MIRPEDRIDLGSLKAKSPARLRSLRKKYRRLKWDSHDGGAGGVKDSEEFKYFQKVLAEIDRL